MPIDVISSVQAISNAYDPQYGKLTGAVSTVDTKASNYENFHFSTQKDCATAHELDARAKLLQSQLEYILARDEVTEALGITPE